MCQMTDVNFVERAQVKKFVRNTHTHSRNDKTRLGVLILKRLCLEKFRINGMDIKFVKYQRSSLKKNEAACSVSYQASLFL